MSERVCYIRLMFAPEGKLGNSYFCFPASLGNIEIRGTTKQTDKRNRH
jgi:hypothetical protein